MSGGMGLMNSLVERDEQLFALEKAFGDCLRGTQQAALITGAVATGKTSLLGAFADRLAGSDAILLSASASRSERGVPLGVLEQLLERVRLTSNGVDQLADDLFHQARDAVSGWRDLGKLRHVIIPLLYRLRKALRDLTDQYPVILCIDDVHNIDSESSECLLYFLRRLRATRLLVVLSECAYTPYEHPIFRAEFLRHTTCARISVNLLSVHGARAILAETLDSNTADRLAPTLHRISGGNPLLLRALIEDHVAVAEADPTEAVVGESFRQAALECLYRCDATTASIARALAIFGEPAPPALLGRLVNIDTDAAAHGLCALNALGLLDSGHFRCSQGLLAILSDMAAADRQALHSHAAQLLYSEGAAAPVVARHLVHADSVTMPWAMSVLEDAAERALLDTDIDLSIACLQLAERLCSDERRQSVMSLASARAQWQVNPSASNRRLPGLLKAIRAGHLDGHQIITVIGYLLWHGHTGDAIDIFERMVEAPTNPPPQYKLEIERARLWLSYTYPGVFSSRRGGEPTPAPINLEQNQIDVHLRAAVVLGGVLTRGPKASTRAGAEQVLQATRLTNTTLAPVTCALASLIYAEHLETAASWCTLFLEEARRSGIPFWRAVLESVASALNVRQGNVRIARDYARSALTLLTPEDWGVIIGVPLASLVFAATAMGRYDEAAACLAIPVPNTMFDSPVGLHYLQARGRYLLALDRHHAALDAFQTCGRLMTSWGMDVPTLIPWRTEAAEAYLRMGEMAQAQKLAQAQLSRLCSDDFLTRGLSLRILAATQGLPRRLSALRDAADILEKCGNRLELARVHADLSRVHQTIGQHRAARIHASRAYRLARECGADVTRWSMLPDLASVEPGVPNHVPAVADRISKLSNAERRVAMLAAEGHTNRQVAKRLFITVSTVEQHMTRIYRKLGVNGRSDLATVLDAAPSGVAEQGAR